MPVSFSGPLVVLPALIESFTAEVAFAGDQNGVAICQMEYQDPVTGQYRPMHTIRNNTAGKFQGLAFSHPQVHPNVLPGLTYQVRAVLSSPEGVDGQSVLAATARTDPKEPPLGMGPERWVDPLAGDDAGGDGSSTNPFRTIPRALQTPIGGMTVTVRPTATIVVNTPILVAVSGTPTDYVTIRSDPAGGPVEIDGQGVPAQVLELRNASYVCVKGFRLRRPANHCVLVGTASSGDASRYVYLVDIEGQEYGSASGGTGARTFIRFNASSGSTIEFMRVVRARCGSPRYQADMVVATGITGIYFKQCQGGHSILDCDLGGQLPGNSMWDAIGGEPNSSYPGNLGRNSEVAHCVARNCADDGFEIDGPNEFVRLWDCHEEDSRIGYSYVSMAVGPCWMAYCTRSDLRPIGSFTGEGEALKLGGSAKSAPFYASEGLFFCYQNAVYSGLVRSHFLANAGNNGYFANHHFFNNAVDVNGRYMSGINGPPSRPNYPNYNVVSKARATVSGEPLVKTVDGQQFANMGLWQIYSWGMDQNSLEAPPRFQNARDLRLQADSPAIGRALYIPGINLPFSDVGAYLGSAGAPPPPPPAPFADFAAAPFTGPAPLSVAFQDLSTGQISTWDWIFGDGGISSLRSPVHAYQNAGDFYPTLTVIGPGGANSVTRLVRVLPPPPPDASFTAVPNSGEPPLSVTLFDTSSGQVTARHWDFGDGLTMDDVPQPVHVYQAPGSYTITLTVTGPGGADTATGVITVTALPPPPPPPLPVADFQVAPVDGSPFSIQFTDLSTGVITGYFWAFGDGATSTEQSPLHQYARPGTYVVTLTVRNISGASFKTFNVVLTEPAPPVAPVADFLLLPANGNAPLFVVFQDVSRGEITARTWDFGDGTSAQGTGEAVTHLYETPGSRIVALSVVGPGGTDTQSRTLTVSAAPLQDIGLGKFLAAGAAIGFALYLIFKKD